MERRALIAALISIVILIAYQYGIAYWYPPKPRSPLDEFPTQAAPSAPLPQEAPHVAAPPPAPLADERRVTVETDFYRAVLVSTGARLESLTLKQHRSSVDPASPPQETVIPGQGGELPFGVEVRGGSGTISDAGAAYAVEGADLNLTGNQAGTVAFAWQSGPMTLRKTFAFHGDHYDFEAKIAAANVPTEYSELGVSWIKRADSLASPGGQVIFDRAFYIDGRKLQEEPFDGLSDGKILEKGEFSWVGYAGPYFLAAATPVEGRNYRLWLKLRDHTVEEMLLFPLSGNAADVPLDVYVGPKDLDTLEKVGRGLTRAVDLGYFSFIALPLLYCLEFSHRFTGNYGVDIILLTVIIKILFIPLTNKSMKSMREMQKLQPQMAKIREKFKDSPEQMNKEIMEMYRRHKVNPLGGCVPMLLQIPVFIGLYQALQNAVELRHAPFMLWINDLSAPDRLGSIQLPFVEHPGIPVLTLLMGATMFIQQWMTPAAGDPAQQRVMMIMPLMFTFMFVNFPAGLVLYWLVNNVLTIAQQYYMTRIAT